MNLFNLEEFKEKIALADLSELEDLREILNKEITLEHTAIDEGVYT